MKIFVVVNVARQTYGEMIFIKTEKAFSDMEKAKACMDAMKADFVKTSNKKIISSPDGNIECLCEISVLEVDLEN